MDGLSGTGYEASHAMRYRVNRRDTGSKALEDHAKKIGFRVAHIGGTWDCDLYLGQWVIPVDWKSKRAPTKPSQQKLLDAGFPLRLIRTTAELDALKAEITEITR